MQTSRRATGNWRYSSSMCSARFLSEMQAPLRFCAGSHGKKQNRALVEGFGTDAGPIFALSSSPDKNKAPGADEAFKAISKVRARACVRACVRACFFLLVRSPLSLFS